MHRAQLRRALGEFEPFDGEHPVVLERFVALIGLPGDIFSRRHFDPGHITSSAMLLSPGEDRVVLIDHRKLKVWLQPGGHIEPQDPSLSDAAHREAIEECGPLELEPMGVFDFDVHQIPAFGSEPAHSHFDVRFLFHVTGGQLGETGEVNAVSWFPISRPPTRLGDSVQRMLDQLAGRSAR